MLAEVCTRTKKKRGGGGAVLEGAGTEGKSTNNTAPDRYSKIIVFYNITVIEQAPQLKQLLTGPEYSCMC